jgi:phage terminase large subunit-like protein
MSASPSTSLAPTPTFSLTPKQAEVRNILAGPERHNLVYGGSRSGKTFLLCYCIATRAISAPNSRHLIARRQNIDVRQSVMMDTWPTMMRLAYPGVEYEINKSDQVAMMDDGREVWFAGLDDKDRVEKILGKEYATWYVNESSQVAYETILTLRTRLAQRCTKVDGRPLKLKAYYDLNPTGRGHWSYQEFVLGQRPDNQMPVEPGSRAYATMNPADNPNLPAEYLAELAALPERQRQRFLEGKYLSEVPGALWPLERIDRYRTDNPPPLTRIVIGVDPSGSDGTGGDRQGIIVAGLGVDCRAYVLDDLSCRMSPNGWAAVIERAFRLHGADLIVAEQNYGGAMVESTLRTAGPHLPIKMVSASRGKHIRAEPVAALYEQGKVSHVGTYGPLEEQMGLMTTAGYQGGDSPDRLDALVWALTELMLDGRQPLTFASI